MAKLYLTTGSPLTDTDLLKIDLVNINTTTFPPSPHNHDDRYYTENEVDNKLPLISQRDFSDGTVITTSIDYNISNGKPFLLEITGNAYDNLLPLDTKVQGYIYGDTIINKGGISNGTFISGLVALNVGGKLTFWFPNQGYWQGYTVACYDVSQKNKRPVNTVISIANGVKPVGTKEVAIDISQTIWNYDPRLIDSRPANDVFAWAKNEKLAVDDVPELDIDKITNLNNLLSSKVDKSALDNKSIDVITQEEYNNLGASRDLLNIIYFIY